MNRFIIKRIRDLIHLNVFSASIFTTAGINIRSLNKRITELIRVGQIDDARHMFDKMPERNTVTWNTMITGYVKRRDIAVARKLFDEMPERDRDVVSWNIMIYGYVSCYGCGGRFVEEGRSLFNRMPERDLVSWNTIISGYAKIGMMDAAVGLFHDMPEQGSVSWNAMISGFLMNGNVFSAVEWFERMPRKDGASLMGLVSGLVQNGELDMSGRILRKISEESNGGNEDLVRAYNTLIAGYGKRGRIREAKILFDQIPSLKFVRNLVSWNTMIMCYVKSGDVISARKLFDEMPERDAFSWNTMLTGYVQKLELEKASELFLWMPNPDTISWNALIHGHAQMGNLELARDYFERMPRKNVVSWNSMLSGFEINGNYGRAVKLFRQMLADGERPDRHTFSSILSISASTVALEFGKQIHQMITKTAISDVPINNALVTMYSRCGALIESRSIFDVTKFQKNVITWNAMIGAYASHGYALQALQLFEEMKKLNVRPTHITFVSVLNACAHAGLAEEGRKYFESMITDFGIEPLIEHFSSLVSIFARLGKLQETMDLINSMPYNKMDKSVWSSLLSACKMHNNVELARVAADAFSKLDPENSAPYVLLYNMYVDLGQWDNATEVRKLLETTNIKKECASSWSSTMPS